MKPIGNPLLDPSLMPSLSYERDALRLIDHIMVLGRCVVAYSGGVDSAVVAAAAFRADQRRFQSADEHFRAGSIAVTADSPSVSREQLETARCVADEIGLRHEIVATSEMDRADYRINDRRRCFYCKQTLYAELAQFGSQAGIFTILSGTNADDLGDYRPGIQAGRDAGVVAPLADLNITKQTVREIAHVWNLSVADRPAQPCLSSRLAYGVGVTRDRLARIELAESFLRDRGYSPLRVRMLANEEGRIEVSLNALDRLRESKEMEAVSGHLLSLGFRSVSVDAQGFRSGSMNELVQIGTIPSSAVST